LTLLELDGPRIAIKPRKSAPTPPMMSSHRSILAFASHFS
jgi:hypothetical protein